MGAANRHFENFSAFGAQKNIARLPSLVGLAMVVMMLYHLFVPVSVYAELKNTPWPLVARLDSSNFDEHVSVEKRYVYAQVHMFAF